MKIYLKSWFIFFFICSLPVYLYSQTVQMHIDVGLNHFYKKRYLEAFREFKAAIEKDPTNAEAHFNLGRVYKAQGFYKEAIAQFETALYLNPNYLQAKRELNEIKKLIKQDKDVWIKLEGQLQGQTHESKLPPVDMQMALIKAQELYKLGKIKDAVRLLEQAYTQDPNNVQVRKSLAFLYFQQYSYSSSLQLYEELTKVIPNDPEIYYAIGLINLRLKNYNKAVEAFNNALAKNNNYVKAIYGLAEAYEAMGRYEDATFNYKRVLSIQPNFYQAEDRLREITLKMGYNYYTRGMYYYEQAEYEKAQVFLSLAKKYLSLTLEQRNQIESVLSYIDFMVSKKREEQKQKREFQTIRQEANITKNVTVEEVVQNPNPWIGKAVEWEGEAAFEDRWKGKKVIYINSKPDVLVESNLDYVFGIVFPKELPNDPRISLYSYVNVKGKILGVEKIYNNTSQTFSRKRQPLIEAVEITFKRPQYEEPLTIRFY